MTEPNQSLAPAAEMEYRFVCGLLRTLTKLLRPEAIGIAVLHAAAECGVPRKQALALMKRFMIEVTLPKEWRPWHKGKP